MMQEHHETALMVMAVLFDLDEGDILFVQGLVEAECTDEWLEHTSTAMSKRSLSLVARATGIKVWQQKDACRRKALKQRMERTATLLTHSSGLYSIAHKIRTSPPMEAKQWLVIVLDAIQRMHRK